MNWHLFLFVFGTIFVAEIPDKTALATLLLATKSSARAVFAGVAAAFFVQTLVATAAGNLLSLVPEKWVHLAAGAMFLGFAVHLWMARNEPEETEDLPPVATGFWRSAASAFLVIFIAEWGDLTQLATASLIAQYKKDQVSVFVAALLALWSVSAIAVFAGARIHAWVRPDAFRRVCIWLFAAIGLVFIVRA